MARVLVTYGWCRSSYQATLALALRGHDVYVCSCRRPAMAAWSRSSRAGAIVADPFALPEQYVADVAEIVERWAIDVILPGHEDALALQRGRSVVSEHVRIACPSLEHLELAVDKAAMTQVAAAAGITTPESAFPTSPAEAIEAATRIGYPVVAKARRSNGGKGVFLANDEQALRTALAGPLATLTRRPETHPFVQQFVDGTIVGSAFLARDGEVVATFGERYLRSKDDAFGTSVLRERMDDEGLARTALRLAQSTRWTGIGHVDLIEERGTGHRYFLELNPRLWGAMHLARINGFDFSSGAVALALGERELSGFFDRSRPSRKRSQWLVGEGIRAYVTLRKHGVATSGRALIDMLRAIPLSRPDDFAWHEPWVLAAEAVCYAKGFVASRGDANPVSAGMLGE